MQRRDIGKIGQRIMNVGLPGLRRRGRLYTPEKMFGCC